MSRILLADDSQQALRLGEQILSSQGIEVVSVTDGASALRRLTDADPDVLITDVFLPTKDGFDLARYIKAQPELKRIRVIFAAGITDQFNEQDAKNAGADAILRKPFEASALLAAVQPLLEQSRTERDNKEENAGSAIDRASIRAAVTLALDAAMPALIEELADRVLLVLNQQRVPASASRAAAAPATDPGNSAA
jgi:CheY-like chemotaxis protein